MAYGRGYGRTKKYHYIYEIVNTVNGKRYIGKRSCDTPIYEDNYLGSGSELKKDIKKYNKKNFEKRILAICSSSEDAHAVERFYIKNRNAVEDSDYYNIATGTSEIHDSFLDKDSCIFREIFSEDNFQTILKNKDSELNSLKSRLKYYRDKIEKLEDDIYYLEHKIKRLER